MSIFNDGEIAAAAMKYLAPEAVEAAEQAAGRLLTESFDTLHQTAGRFVERLEGVVSEEPVANPDWIPPDKSLPLPDIAEWHPGIDAAPEPSIDELRGWAERYVEQPEGLNEGTMTNPLRAPNVEPTAANPEEWLSGPEPIEGNYGSFDGEWHSRRRY